MNWKTLAVLLLGITFAGDASAQRPGNIPYGGSEVFRFALHKKDVKPNTDPDEAWKNPTRNIIIILGDTSALPFQMEGQMLHDFVQNGGALLIASDTSNIMPGIQQPAFQQAPASWGQIFGITITGRHLTAAKDVCYRDIDGRPFVKIRDRKHPSPSPADIFEGFDDIGSGAIATDHPSEMAINVLQGRYRYSYLAAYPVSARTMARFAGVQNDFNNFAVAMEPIGPRGVVSPTGRFLCLADHSVFVNGMMGFQEDGNAENGFTFNNANWKFSNRTIDWLKSGAREPRTQCLFIEDGRIVEKFAVELPQVPKPPMPDIPPDVLANWALNMSNRLIDDAQQKNFFNRLLESWLGFPRLLRTFLLIVTVVFVFFCLRWLRKAVRKSEPSQTLTPMVQSRLLPKGGVLRQRTTAQMDVGNFSEAAGRRVRERFDVLGGQPGPDAKMPPLLTADDLRDELTLRQSIRWLWQIGYGDGPVAVPATEWDRFNALLERAALRATRGDWSFGQNLS